MLAGADAGVRGFARWLARHATPAALTAYEENRQRRTGFLQLTQATRRVLEGLYEPDTQKNQGFAIVNSAQTAMKNIAINLVLFTHHS